MVSNKWRAGGGGGGCWAGVGLFLPSPRGGGMGLCGFDCFSYAVNKIPPCVLCLRFFILWCSVK